MRGLYNRLMLDSQTVIDIDAEKLRLNELESAIFRLTDCSRWEKDAPYYVMIDILSRVTSNQPLRLRMSDGFCILRLTHTLDTVVFDLVIYTYDSENSRNNMSEHQHILPRALISGTTVKGDVLR